MSSGDISTIWDKSFVAKGQYFAQLQSFEKELSLEQWPDMEWFNLLADRCDLPKPHNHLGLALTFMSEEMPSLHALSAMSYEEKIYHCGLVPTRLNNWHDLFNQLTWLMWPKTKAILNARYVIENTKRLLHQSRTPTQHFIAQFDECGIVICVSKEALHLQDAIMQHDWRNVFCTHKAEFGRNIECLILGHALFEKGLEPYIGLTAKAYFLIVESEYFQNDLENKRSIADAALANAFWMQSLSVKNLYPFPMLGVPNWFANQDEIFYTNQHYFRGKSAKLVALP